MLKSISSLYSIFMSSTYASKVKQRVEQDRRLEVAWRSMHCLNEDAVTSSLKSLGRLPVGLSKIILL
jgi:hypothetical protein